MKSLNQFLIEATGDAVHKDPVTAHDTAGPNSAIQSNHKGARIQTDNDSEHYSSYNVYVNGGDKHKYVWSGNTKSHARITHYKYPLKKKPSFVSDATHEKIKKQGRFVVQTPDHAGIYHHGRDETHYKTATAAKNAAIAAGKVHHDRQVAMAHGAAATYSHRNFSQTSYRS